MDRKEITFLEADDAVRLRQWRERWDLILRDGVIVDLSITQWYPYAAMNEQRMERLGVRMETDEAKAAAKAVLHSGKIDLVPAAAYRPIHRLSNALRENLYSRSHKIMFGYLLPATAYPGWKERHEELLREWERAVDDLVGNRLSLMAQQRNLYMSLFEDAFVRLIRAGAIPIDSAPMAMFVDEAIADLQSEVPDRDTVRDAYQVTTAFSYAPMADELAAAEERAQQIRLRIIDDEDARGDAYRQIMADMQAQVASQVEQRRAQVERSMAEAEQVFYGQISQIVNDLRSGLQERDGKLLGRGAVQVRNLIAQVRSLNVFDDAALTSQIDALEASVEAHVAPGASKGDTLADLFQALSRVAIHANAALVAVPKLRGVRQVGVVDSEAPEVAPARRLIEVGVDEAVPVTAVRRRSA